MREKSKGESN